MKKYLLITLILITMINDQVKAQEGLDKPEKSLIKIAALTASGNLTDLKTALNEGLEAGLTINQVNDELAQLYAYCGFPRSLNAINTFMKVVEERKSRGINDKQGEALTSVKNDDNYEKGRKTLENLTGKAQLKPAPGFGEFNPIIDRFLKEHLFADIFDSQLLTYKQRELATIAALASMEGVEPQLQVHFSIGTNVGITETALKELVEIVGSLKQKNVNEPTSMGEIEFLKFQLNMSTAVDHQVSGKYIIRLTEIEILPEYFEEYISILKEESSASVLKESGVISIFPLVQKQDPTQIRILEFYSGQEAYKAHIASAHFQKYKTSTLHMVKGLKLIDMYVIDAETMPSIFEKLNKQ